MCAYKVSLLHCPWDSSPTFGSTRLALLCQPLLGRRSPCFTVGFEPHIMYIATPSTPDRSGSSQCRHARLLGKPHIRQHHFWSPCEACPRFLFFAYEQALFRSVKFRRWSAAPRQPSILPMTSTQSLSRPHVIRHNLQLPTDHGFVVHFISIGSG